MSDFLFCYENSSTESSKELKDFCSSIKPFGAQDAARLGLFIDASTKSISPEKVINICSKIKKIDTDILYCFAIGFGKYAKFYIKFFEEILSFFRITIAYQQIYKPDISDKIIADIENEKYKLLPRRIFARSKAKKFARIYL